MKPEVDENIAVDHKEEHGGGGGGGGGGGKGEEEEKMESDGGREDAEAPGSVGIQCPTPAVCLKEPAMVSAFLRPLVEMTKEELMEICTNLEIALSLKDQEINAINQHYEHVLELYYDTADTLAVRNCELLSCQDHLKEAQSCLEQWRTEIVCNQSAHQPRQSVVSDSVLLEGRRGGIDTPPSRPTEPAKENDDVVDNRREDLDNPKRVSRRLNQSVDLHAKTRITPVLHRRKSSRNKDGETRPVPKPRQSVSRWKADDEAGHSDGSEEMVKTCLDPDLLKDMDLGVTSPLRMSYLDDPTKVDILQIEEDRRMSSSDSDDTLMPSVREKCPVDEQDTMDTDTLCGSNEWSSFDDRPRTDCGRPLTGERRPDDNDRPPTRSGGRCRDVAASYSFEGHRPHPDSPVHVMRSTMDNVAVKNGQNNGQPRKPKIIFKEIKSEENNIPIRRPQTPHVRYTPRPHEEAADGVA